MGLFWAFLMEKWHLNIIKNFPTYLSRSASTPSSLSSSLFMLSHRMVRKHNPSHKLMLTGTGSFLILHLRHYMRLGRNAEVSIAHQLIMPYSQALLLTTCNLSLLLA